MRSRSLTLFEQPLTFNVFEARNHVDIASSRSFEKVPNALPLAIPLQPLINLQHEPLYGWMRTSKDRFTIRIFKEVRSTQLSRPIGFFHVENSPEIDGRGKDLEEPVWEMMDF